jgi:serine/threonine protein kinase
MHPARMLSGRQLPTGWMIIKPMKRSSTATGSIYSVGYVAEHADGRKGFLKAMDYAAAFSAINPSQVLQSMTTAYLFERDICQRIKSHALRRVVHAIESGTITVDTNNPFSKVEYLIFDLAEGDIRTHLEAQRRFDLAFVLRTLHHVATGLEQLHRARMAHQDLKPSNVLVFPDGAGSKIGDFGKAWAQDFIAPHDNDDVAGDHGYAPPELLYGHVASDVQQRRYGCDAYHMGSFAVFLFTRSSMNALIIRRLALEHGPSIWGGTYREVLPYLQLAFAGALEDFAGHVNEPVKVDLVEVVSQLCEPDPTRRGHPLNRQGYSSQFSLDRYISKFDLLAHRAELRLIG